MSNNTWLKKNTSSLSEKNVVITGTTNGLGFQTLKLLCKLGANIITGVRDTVKAENQKKEILKEYPNAQITVYKLDLSDISSVKKFINKVRFLCSDGIDILINNAGLFSKEKRILNNGYEQHFFINCVAPIFLTKSLVPHLEMRENSKVVFLGSISCNFTEIDFEDFDYKNNENDMHAYANSKRWLTFSAFKLKEELKDKNITVNVVHPGISPTSLFLNSRFKKLQPILKLIFPSPKKACLCEIVGSFKNTKQGEWIGPRIFNIWGKPKISKLKIKHFHEEELGKCYEKINEIISEIA